MTGKTKTQLKWIPSLVIAILLTGGATMKFAHAASLVAQFSKIGFQDRMIWIGAMEMVFVGLFLWNRTMIVGLLLFTGYFGGAMAIEMSLGMLPLAPGLILTMIWIAAFLRNPSLFRFPTFEPANKSLNL